MTRLRMNWKLIEGMDGKKFLGMQWEVPQTGIVPACGRPRRNRIARRKAA
jgi:hypothetical protein